MTQLAAGALEVPELRAVAGRGEVVQAVEELVVAEPEAFLESSRGGNELTPPEVLLGAPANRLQAPLGRGPLVARVLGHGRGRA